jgi:hypothetical protein
MNVCLDLENILRSGNIQREFSRVELNRVHDGDLQEKTVYIMQKLWVLVTLH